MFKVTFIKLIYDAQTVDPEARFAAMSRALAMPFAPAMGLRIFWGLELPQCITEVTWNVGESSFSCKVPDEFPDRLSVDGMNFDELLDNSKANGWTLVKVYDRT